MSAKVTNVAGKVGKRIVKETEFEWVIKDFLSAIESFHAYKSPVFYFANDAWCFELYQSNVLHKDFLAVYLFCDKEREYSVEYCFGLKRQDGSVEHRIRRVLPGDKKWTDQWKFIKRSDVQARMSELAPSGNFTITCRLRSEADPSFEPIVLDKQKLQMLKKLDTLSENFKNLFINKESCDVTLHVMDKEYKAHRAVLIARSPVFAAMFLHETSEKQTGIITISDCDPDSFEEFLEFLYCGRLHKLSFRNALHLYETSNKYDVEELKTFCSESLVANFSVENVCDVVIIADKYDEANLMFAAQDFFNKNLDKIFDSSEWDSLVKNNYRLSKKLLKGMSTKMKAVN